MNIMNVVSSRHHPRPATRHSLLRHHINHPTFRILNSQQRCSHPLLRPNNRRKSALSRTALNFLPLPCTCPYMLLWCRGVPNSWLKDQHLFVCSSCHQLVSIYRIASHSQCCREQAKFPVMFTAVSASSPTEPNQDLPSFEVC